MDGQTVRRSRLDVELTPLPVGQLKNEILLLKYLFCFYNNHIYQSTGAICDLHVVNVIIKNKTEISQHPFDAS